MSGQLCNNVIALLEQSVGHDECIKAHQSLPVRSRQGHEEMNIKGKEHVSRKSMHHSLDKENITSVLAQIMSDLPPTPPSMRHRPSDSTLSVPQRVRIPFSASGPPTPDCTPPSGVRKGNATLKRPPMPHFPSSRAESFVTAKEYSTNLSTQTSRSSLSLELTGADKSCFDASRNSQHDPRISSPPLDKRQNNTITEGSQDITDNDLTPIAGRDRISYFQHEVHAGIDTSLSGKRNATKVRRKRRVSDLVNAAHNGRPLLHLDEPRIKQTSRKSSEESLELTDPFANHRCALPAGSPSPPSEDSQEEDWPTATNDMLYRALRDEKAKRFSDISQTSITTIQAAIIPIQKQKPQTLRHARKNIALRDHVSRHMVSPTTETTIRQPVLRHKKARLSNGIVQSRAVSNAEPRSIGQVRESDTYEESVSKLSAAAIGHHSPADHEPMPFHHSGAIASIPRRAKPPKLRHVSAPLPTTRPILINEEDPVKELSRGSGHDPNIVNPPLQRTGALSLELPHQATLESAQSTPDLAECVRIEVAAVQDLEITYPLASQSRPADYESLSFQTTASMSQSSAHTIDINEAKVINLFHPVSDSVTVVQHLPSSKTVSQRTEELSSEDSEEEHTPTEDEPLPQLDHPRFLAVVEPPSTRPSTSGQTTVHSCGNSQAYSWSAPPALAVIPPTPSPELHKGVPTPATVPGRSPSLIQRARHYSDTIIQPFLPPSPRPNPPVSSSTYSSTPSAHSTIRQDQEEALHPYWRPRRSWDEPSSPESDPEDYYYDDPFDPETDRLPPGGDTSSVPSIGKRRRQRGGLLARMLPRMITLRMSTHMRDGVSPLGANTGKHRDGNALYAKVNRPDKGRTMHSSGFVTLFSANSVARKEHIGRQQRRQVSGRKSDRAGSSNGRSVARRNHKGEVTMDAETGSETDDFALPFFASSRRRESEKSSGRAQQKPRQRSTSRDSGLRDGRRRLHVRDMT